MSANLLLAYKQLQETACTLKEEILKTYSWRSLAIEGFTLLAISKIRQDYEKQNLGNLSLKEAKEIVDSFRDSYKKEMKNEYSN